MSAITPTRAALILSAVVLTCHAVLPFTDYVCYDDLYLINWVNCGRTDYMWRFLEMHGNQPAGVYYAACSALSPFTDLVVPLKVAGVGIAFMIGWLAWRVGTESGLLTAAEALTLAAVAVAFPGVKVKGGLAYSQYDWAPAALLLGTLLALRAEGRAGLSHLALRLGSHAAFLASFLTGSAMAFYGGCFWVLVLADQRRTGRRWYQIPWRFLISHPDYLALPFAYYATTRTVFRSYGHYADYNKPTLAADRIEAAYRSLPEVFTDPFTLFPTYPVAVQLALVALGLLVGWAGSWAARRGADQAPEAGPRPATTPIGLFVFGLVLLVLATFPYAAVGRKFGAWGQPSSYSPFIPLSSGVLLLAVKAAIGVSPRTARLVPAILAAVGVCWVAVWWNDYLLMQSVEARNRAVLRQIRAHPEARACSVYCIDNRYPIPRTTSPLHGWEWVYTDAGTRGDPRSFGYNGLPNMAVIPPWYVRQCLVETTLGHATGSIDSDGKQGILVVRRRDPHSDTGIGARYLVYKYARAGRLGAYMDRLVGIEFFPAPWDHAGIKARVESGR